MTDVECSTLECKKEARIVHHDWANDHCRHPFIDIPHHYISIIASFDQPSLPHSSSLLLVHHIPMFGIIFVCHVLLIYIICITSLYIILYVHIHL